MVVDAFYPHARVCCFLPWQAFYLKKGVTLDHDGMIHKAKTI